MKNAKKEKGGRKLAIVMSGGGMRCAYGSGALLAIAEQYKLTEPDILIAASGSAGPSAYYLSGQAHLGALLWIRGATNPKFISFRRHRVLDIDYLIDDVFKKQYPLDFKKIRSKKTKWLLPVTRVRDGATVYLSPKRTQEVYEYLRAAKAIPVAYGKTVKIGNEEYIDGDFGSQTEDLARKALQEGAQDIILIESNPESFGRKAEHVIIRGSEIEQILLKKTGLAKAAARELERKKPLTAPQGVRLVVISPSKASSVHVVTRKKLNLRTAFNLGYADARDNAELRELLTPPKKLLDLRSPKVSPST